MAACLCACCIDVWRYSCNICPWFLCLQGEALYQDSGFSSSGMFARLLH
jgi:hypothetical protein